MYGPQHAKPAIERVMRKVAVENRGHTTPCWTWRGFLHSDGYARVTVGSKTDRTRGVALAHRVAYEHFVGPVPEGLELDHLCRVRDCCNPSHLEAVTRRENIRRGLRGVLKTHCPNGHPYDEDNTFNSKQGRKCRACNRARMRASNQREAAA